VQNCRLSNVAGRGTAPLHHFWYPCACSYECI